MGLGPRISRSVYEPPVILGEGVSQIPVGNPDPKNYEINGIRYIGEFLILDITYPDAKNYEGRKILVYDGNLLLTDLMRQPKGIDPHFSYEPLHPIARFEPTEQGMANATLFCKVRFAKLD